MRRWVSQSKGPVSGADIGIRAPAVTPDTLRGRLVELQGDGRDVDAINQVGTNLSMERLAAAAELWLGKPVTPSTRRPTGTRCVTTKSWTRFQDLAASWKSFSPSLADSPHKVDRQQDTELGRISMEGTMPPAPSLDTIGFLARSATDIAAIWATLFDEPKPFIAGAC